MGMPLLILPSSIAIGDLISFANEKVETREGRKDRYTFAGASYFKRMQEVGPVSYTHLTLPTTSRV